MNYGYTTVDISGTFSGLVYSGYLNIEGRALDPGGRLEGKWTQIFYGDHAGWRPILHEQDRFYGVLRITVYTTAGIPSSVTEYYNPKQRGLGKLEVYLNV